MTTPVSNTIPRVPKGFQNILKEIATEVLRSQPNNIFVFGAQYFEQCLRVRDANRSLARFEQNQIKSFDCCIFHTDRVQFDKITREIEHMKIIPKAYVHRLAMAVCSCKRRKVNLNSLLTETTLKEKIKDLEDRLNTETTWPDSLVDYLYKMLRGDNSLKQDSKCRFIYVIHQAVFHNNYDMLTRAAITSNLKKEVEKKVEVRKHFSHVTSHPETFITNMEEFNTSDIEAQPIADKDVNTFTAIKVLTSTKHQHRDTLFRLTEEAWHKRRLKCQHTGINSWDIVTQTSCLATNVKNDFMDCFDRKVLSKKKSRMSSHQKVARSVLDGGHCRNCFRPFVGLKSDASKETCRFHPGYIHKGNYRWTCCGEPSNYKHKFEDHSQNGCCEDRHIWTPKYKKKSNTKPGINNKDESVRDITRKLTNQNSHISTNGVLYLYDKHDKLSRAY